MLVVREKAEVPTDAKKIRLTKGLTAFVSPEDFDKVKSIYWRAVKSSGNFYAHTRVISNGKVLTIRMHRLLTRCPPFCKVHHIDHNTLNNCRENLKIVSESEHRTLDGWHYFEH
jgi:hypothetical protein